MPHDEKERCATSRWPLYNDCSDVTARLAMIIPRVQAERTQAQSGLSVIQPVATIPGRWPLLYDDCVEETRRLLARIEECLGEDPARDD